MAGVSTSGAPAKGSDFMFYRLQEKSFRLQMGIEKQKVRVAKIEKQRKAIEARQLAVKTRAKRQGGVYAGKWATQNMSRTRKILEHRLNRLKQRECTIKTNNNNLKELINGLRRVRLQQQQTFDKFKAELKQVDADTEQAKLEADGHLAMREDYEQRTKELMDMDKAEALQHEADKAGYKAEVEMYKEMEVQHNLLAMQRAQGLIEDNVSEAAKEETLIEQAKHAAADLVAAKKEFAKADARARKYEQVFDKLMEDTQLYNLNELVPQLVNQDSELLLALGWVQNLHADIESAEAKLRELKDTLTVFHRDQVRHSAHAKLHSAIKKATLMRIHERVGSVQMNTWQKYGRLASQLSIVKRVWMMVGCMDASKEYMINKDTGIAVNEWEPTRDGMTISVVTKRLGEIEEKVQGLVFSCVEFLEEQQKQGPAGDASVHRRLGSLSGTPKNRGQPGYGFAAQPRASALRHLPASAQRNIRGARTAANLLPQQIAAISEGVRRGPPVGREPGRSPAPSVLPVSYLVEDAIPALRNAASRNDLSLRLAAKLRHVSVARLRRNASRNTNVEETPMNVRALQKQAATDVASGAIKMEVFRSPTRRTGRGSATPMSLPTSVDAARSQPPTSPVRALASHEGGGTDEAADGGAGVGSGAARRLSFTQRLREAVSQPQLTVDTGASPRKPRHNASTAKLLSKSTRTRSRQQQPQQPQSVRMVPGGATSSAALRDRRRDR